MDEGMWSTDFTSTVEHVKVVWTETEITFPRLQEHSTVT